MSVNDSKKNQPIPEGKDTSLLEVKNLGVTINTKPVLQNISFSVKRGETLAIIGPNGAGKTILLRSLMGLLPYQGIITWHKGVRIDYVPQKFSVEETMPVSVREFFLLKSGNFWRPRKDFFFHLKHELKIVGLSEEIMNHLLGEISGGELHRVLIAWAIAGHPDVLLVDEPTAGIDIGFEETVYTILKALQKERHTTIILVSHDLNIVYRYADNVLFINKNMLCHGKPQDALNPKELVKLYG